MKKIFGKISDIIQRVVMKILLLVLYIIGFGIACIGMCAATALKFLWKRRMARDTNWKDAQGYQPDISDCMHQS